jgi:hypothetical protein
MRLRDALLAAGAVALPIGADACEYLTQHFELCAEGTDWANGVWEQGGDSATLYLGQVGFEGFEEYLARGEGPTPADELNAIQKYWSDDAKIEPFVRDTMTTDYLTVERSIDTLRFGDDTPVVRATMIASAKGEQIMLMVSAPPEMPLAEMEYMSRHYARLVRPTANVGN